MPTAQYRKRPLVVEAMQLTRDNLSEVVNWMEACSPPGKGWMALEGFTIRTDSGEAMVESGDWIIRGIQGEFYPCKAEVFRLTYESAAEPLAAFSPAEWEVLRKCVQVSKQLSGAASSRPDLTDAYYENLLERFPEQS